MNASWKHICTCKSHNSKQLWNTKTSQYDITATAQYYRKRFCSCSYILVVHFTASTIWGTKVRVGWNVELPLHVSDFKMFLTLPKFEWSCFSWSNFDLGCCNLLTDLQCMQFWITLFKFAQMVRYPSLNEALSINQIWSRVLKFALMFLSVCNFKCSGCILFKMEWSCLKLPKIERRSSTWPEGE